MFRLFSPRFVAAAGLALGLALVGPPPLGAAEPVALDFVPKNAIAVVTVRPAAVLAVEGVGATLAQLAPLDQMEKDLGFGVKNITRVTFAYELAPRSEPVFNGIVETDRDVDWTAVMKRGPGEKAEIKVGPYFGLSNVERDGHALVIGPRMVMFASTREMLEAAVSAGTTGGAKLEWVRPLAALDQDALAAAAFDHAPVARLVERGIQDSAREDNLIAAAMFAPLWKDVRSTSVVFKARPALRLEIAAATASPEAAASVKRTLDAVNTVAGNLAKNYVELAPRAKSPEEELRRTAIRYGARLSERVETAVEGTTVTLSTGLDVDAADLLKTTMQAATVARGAAQRAQTVNNLRQILLALHNYHDVHLRFPSSSVLGPDGKTPHSWRVAILPFIEQEALYRQYKFDEPWDSEANKKVLAQMPAIYRAAGADPTSTNAWFFAPTGDRSIIARDKGLGIQHVTDGTSNTIMIVEAKREIPWTKPEDVDFDPKKPLPEFVGSWGDQILVGFGDGSTRFLSRNLAAEKLRALLTRDGGEVIDAIE